MEKTATLNLRVNPIAKKNAENVLKQLGIPMSVAIDMYLNQISLTGGIPFRVALPKAPDSKNMDLMSDIEIHSTLQEGIMQANKGMAVDAKSAFEDFERKHQDI